MAKKKKFLLLSLKEEESKKLAQVISNSTCRKILDFMSDKENVTEGEIAKSLKLSPSTVHYNLTHLKKGGLIESEDFHYSEKGREVHHWRLANQYIIIAPGKTWGLKEKLKGILPIVGVAGGVALALELLTAGVPGASLFGKAAVHQMELQRSVAEPTAAEAVLDSSPGDAVPSVAATSQPMAAEHVAPAVSYASPSIALWFFIGSMVAIGLYLLVDYIRYKRQ